jgi:hypothetical protein
MSFAEYFGEGPLEYRAARITQDGAVVNAGFDTAESVQKVAMMVWNPSLLQWERGTSTGGGGGGGGAAAVTTKRIDKRNATELYVGNAEVGTVESAASWGIQKITFDISGNATAALYAVGSWDNRYILIYG